MSDQDEVSHIIMVSIRFFLLQSYGPLIVIPKRNQFDLTKNTFNWGTDVVFMMQITTYMVGCSSIAYYINKFNLLYNRLL